MAPRNSGGIRLHPNAVSLKGRLSRIDVRDPSGIAELPFRWTCIWSFCSCATLHRVSSSARYGACHHRNPVVLGVVFWPGTDKVRVQSPRPALHPINITHIESNIGRPTRYLEYGLIAKVSHSLDPGMSPADQRSSWSGPWGDRQQNAGKST